jgi:Na+/phosphate symporter
MSADKKDLSGILAVFLLAVVGLALTPTIQTSATNAAENMTGAAQTLIQLFPLFWSVLMIAMPVAAVVVWLKG